ncbi:MAG: ATP-binding protein [Clostridium sp.]|nr:ATP-binding protein [Clostridium sp.]
MDFKRRWTAWAHLALASILAAAFSAMAAVFFGNWFMFVVSCFGVLCSFAYIFSLYRKVRRNVAFVLDAVENNDFAFRYSTGKRATDPNVNSYLNNLIDLLERLVDDAREKDRIFEVILNSVDNGIIVIDNAGAVLHCNHAARKLLHAEVITNIKHLARVHPSLPGIFLSETPPPSIELSLPDGQISLSLSRSTAPLFGKQVHIIALSDISRSLDSKEMESWENLTRVLTHEIMNSLTPVISICDSLINDAQASAEDYHRGLSTVSSTGKSLKRFVENFRSISKIPEPKPAPFYAAPFLQMMRDISLHQFPDTKAKVIVKCHPVDLMIYADAQLIGLAVTNILKNAMQAMADVPDPEIKVVARLLPGEAVEIAISNNGPIIPPEAAAKIFMPFFTTKPGGSGIGLSIAKRIMALSNASISLSTRPRTTFTLTFP